MTNLSLKEQLEALSIELPSTSPAKEKPISLPPSPQQKPRQAKAVRNDTKKPQWLEQAQYGVELLKAYFPLCFKEMKEVQPLKIGIKQDLVKQLSTMTDVVVSDKSCMVNSLSYYVNSPAYHKSVVAKAVRIDLDGNPAGVVTEEEAKYSVERRKAKLQKKATA
jgi:ProP effector